MDQRESVIDGKRITVKTLESTKEKDGVKFPHVLKEVTCDPPCDMKTLQDFVQLRETIGSGHDQGFLQQFLHDAQAKNMAPERLVKYQNEVLHDSNTNKQNYTINISFLDKNNQRHVY